MQRFMELSRKYLDEKGLTKKEFWEFRANLTDLLEGKCEYSGSYLLDERTTEFSDFFIWFKMDDYGYCSIYKEVIDEKDNDSQEILHSFTLSDEAIEQMRQIFDGGVHSVGAFQKIDNLVQELHDNLSFFLSKIKY